MFFEKAAPGSAEPEATQTSNTTPPKVSTANYYCSTTGATHNGLQVSAEDIVDYLIAVTGNAQGYVCVAWGNNPYRNTKGSIRFRYWNQKFVRWPHSAREALGLLLYYSPRFDAYVCPNVLAGPERAEDTSVAPVVVWADVDDGLLDVAKVRSIPGGFAVGSGTPGNGHVYAMLDRPVLHHQHEVFNRALKKYFGAKDSKISDNDVLRPPGTWNYKPTVDGGDPLPVTWAVRPTGERVAPKEMAEFLEVELTDEPPEPVRKAKGQSKPQSNSQVKGPLHTDLEVEPFNLRRYPEVGSALRQVTFDRSADTMWIVGACVRAGLTLANARWAVMQRDDLAYRLLYECRHDDVARCFERAINLKVGP